MKGYDKKEKIILPSIDCEKKKRNREMEGITVRKRQIQKRKRKIERKVRR